MCSMLRGLSSGLFLNKFDSENAHKRLCYAVCKEFKLFVFNDGRIAEGYPLMNTIIKGD